MATKRRRTTKKASSRYLPIDVVGDILSRLPSKSLLRFKCACKTWRDLITDHKFIEFHMNQNNNGHIFIQHEIYSDHNNHVKDIFSLHCEKTFVEHTRLELPCPKFRVLGYSNGLVCLSRRGTIDSDSNDDIYLWNPSIRKLKLLPDSSSYSNWYWTIHAVYAFAFVSQFNDYRVLKIGYNPYDSFALKTEIYSLSTNSWKMFEQLPQFYVNNNSNRFTRVVNGVVHFMAKDVDYNHIILSFNMVDEVFVQIMIPKSFTLDLRPKTYPIMFEKLLLVILDGDAGCFVDVDIRAMNEYGGTVESWTPKLKFDLYIYIELLGSLKNGELVWRDAKKLSSYDPTLSKINDLEFDEGPGICSAFTHYTESLALLND